ncbi:MAG TPA: hypothetical protein VK837_05375 [Longimicrobiales bacterium]|nr:hypothetical protein [Longimicrobiales bacterium]
MIDRRPALLGLLVLTACANAEPDDPAPPVGATRAITGTPAVVGTDVQSWVQFQGDGETVRIVGPLTPEISALQSYRVRIVGDTVDDPGPVQAFHVIQYDLLEVGGETPVVGTLLRVGSDFWIAEPDSVGGERLQLIGVPAAIGADTGGKIWVVGDRGTSQIRVRTYGVIRGPASP